VALDPRFGFRATEPFRRSGSAIVGIERLVDFRRPRRPVGKQDEEW
jgi:hypothetical protein